MTKEVFLIPFNDEYNVITVELMRKLCKLGDCCESKVGSVIGSLDEKFKVVFKITMKDGEVLIGKLDEVIDWQHEAHPFEVNFPKHFTITTDRKRKIFFFEIDDIEEVE